MELADYLLHKEYKNLSGVYIIKNKINNKVYIGQSVSIYERIKNHVTSPNLKSAIDLAIKKYGVENFTWEIISTCKITELNQLERMYIKNFNSNNTDYGYNLTPGGDSNFGEENPQSIFTEKQVLDIRILYTFLERQMIFLIFDNYSERTVTSILSGQNWNFLLVYKKQGYVWSFPSSYTEEKKQQMKDYIEQRKEYLKTEIIKRMKGLI